MGKLGEVDMVIAIDEALCSDAVMANLSQLGIRSVAIDSNSDISYLLQDGNVDAFLLSPNFPFSKITNDVSDVAGNSFLVMVAADAPASLSDAINNIADAIVTTDMQYLPQQVANLVRLHYKNQQTQQRVGLLEADIATQKRKMKEIELLKNAIVRNVSHELRTPLLQVKSAVSLIGEDHPDKKLVDYAKNAVSRLETHIKNITMLGHSLETNANPIILRDTIEYAKRNLSRIWTRKADSERIHIVLDDNLAPVVADKQGLSTVLQLLMDNALKFGDDNDIEISGRMSGDKIRIAVRDTGIGIATDELQYIFESFYQIDDSSTRPYGGAGVGLALVKLILENHQSKIHVESALNQGSTFWFELPKMNFDDL